MRGRNFTFTALLLCILLLTIPSALGAEDQLRGMREETIESVGSSTIDQPLSSLQNEIEITATQDASRASLRTILGHSSGSQGRLFSSYSSWSLIASAPLDKKKAETELANLDGFANAFKATLNFTQFLITLKNPYCDPELERICKEMKDMARQLGLSEEQVKDMGCDLGNIAEYLPRRLNDFKALFWDIEKAKQFWGAEVSVGHESFKYLNASDLSEARQDEVPWSGKVFYAFIPPRTASLITVGAEYRHAFKGTDQVTVCPPPSGDTPIECETGPLGAPDEREQHLLSVSWRTLFWQKKYGLSVQATYDFNADNLILDLPIYLLRGSENEVNGGIRFGWSEDDNDLEVGVFVGKALKIFN